MQRENYYIILELSVDPPENDRSVIDKAIQSKKVEWSRLRNHPTKGLQVQKFINMIPDIQSVMLDENLRKKEAAAAAELLASGKEDKISAVDGHIDILMGKGYIAKEDIIRLAEIHGLTQNEINERIAAKKETKYASIDQLISLRMAKGYITEDELLKMARKNSMDAATIRKRIRCPILKDEKEAENLQIRPLDKSIEKAINDNLKIVGKKTLYDFLGLTGNADLNNLQDRAGKKKKNLATIGKKDAVVTAGITLAGHCLTIFKSDESRTAYDVSLAKAKLSTLDSDIHIAAINNKIRHEYFDALIDKAMAFGMDEDEASSYIQNFCREKKYRIEKKPPKKRRLIIAAGISVLSAILVISGFVVFSNVHHKRVLASEYQQTIKKVDSQNQPDQKIRLLKKYINSHGQSEFIDDARRRIKKIQLQISADKFHQMMAKTDRLIESEKFEDALAVYQRHLPKISQKEHKNILNRRIKDIQALIEKRDFEELSTVALKGTPDRKIDIFQKYLATHPSGKHKPEVEDLISEISSEYFIYVQRMLAFYETHEKWEESARLCQNYIDIYDNSNSDLLKQMLPEYKEKIRNEKVYRSLVEKADELGTNYTAATQIFKDYLEAYPESSIAEKIKMQIKRLSDLISDQNIKRASNAIRLKISRSNGRFIEKKPGAILDTRTGLMWSLLDSDTVKPDKCLSYEQGKEYVEALTTGGFSDWRLPTPDELSGIYKTTPSFPADSAKSYWTSENYTGYSDGWQIQVVTLSSEDSDHWEIVRKNALECGAVRAVRNP